MTTTLTKYRIYCNDESTVLDTDFLTGAPKCPNNSGHTLDSSKTTLLTTFSTNTTIIDQGSVGTQGFFRVRGHILNIPAGNTGDVSLHDFIIRKYTTSTILGIIYATDDNLGDTFSIYTKPDFQIGTITSDLDIGSTGMTMNSVAYVKFGGYLKLSNPGLSGPTANDLRECYTVSGNFVTFETPTTIFFPSGSNVLMSMTNVINYPLVTTVPMSFGKIAGAPVNFNSRLSYCNNSGTAKQFNLVFGTLY